MIVVEKGKFKENLNEVTCMLLQITAKFCYNVLSQNTVYLIVPNSRDKREHLDRLECDVLDIWNKNTNRQLSLDQIVDLLCHDNRVPLWVNISVFESMENITIVELLCSRRLRNENELMHKDKIPPFYEEGIKFDINWRVKSKLSQKKPYFSDWFKRILGG